MPLLTPHETRVVQEITEWKATPPGLYTTVTSKLAKPFAWAMQHVIPEAAARKAIEIAYATSDWLANPQEILTKGGVHALQELQHKSLELSDSLADQVSHGSQTLAAVDGAVTGAGGFLLAAADVGSLAVLALRAIHRTGHCYGYALDQPNDRSWVLGVMLVAGTKSSTERLELLGQLYNVNTWVLSETFEAIAMEQIGRELIAIASLDVIPGIGAAIGSGTNLYFIRQVLKAARCVFQERWLRANGKMPSV